MKNRFLFLFPFLLGMLPFVQAEPEVALEAPGSAEKAKTGPVYVIPVDAVIDTGMLHVVRRGIKEASRLGASAIILKMDTPGGRVDVMEEIVQRLLRSKVRTYTFVEKDAMSAGAIIALATDEIYMAPGSRIGAATPILASPEGGLQNIGSAEREKMNSAMDAVVRSIAQQKGRDPKLATAMVRAESGYVFHGTVIVETNRILTLTNQEAERRYGPENEPVLSLGTYEDIPTMARAVLPPGTEIVELEHTGLEGFARLLSTAGPLLLIIASLLMYIEINTPGFGWAGLTSLSLFALYFFGQHIAGLAGYEEILIFATGVILLIVEIFLIPGFGLAGIAGILLVFASVFMSMIEHLPPLPGEGILTHAPEIPGLTGALLRMMIVLAGSSAGVLFLASWLPKSQVVNRRLVLGQSLHAGSAITQESTGVRVGENAMAETDLRPAGKILVGDRLIDVVADGDFIPRGTSVRVSRIEGSRIVVEAIG